jgi:hypothetical protein
VLASLALVPAAIGVLAPAGPDDGCPSPRQVTEAMTAHLGGAVLPLGQAPGPTALRLSVVTDAGGITRLDVADPGGEIVLHRTLTPADRTRGPDCPALAETAALIVERYWHEVGYDLPPLPRPAPPPAAPPATAPVIEARPPPPAAAATGGWRWSAAAAAEGRAGLAGSADVAALLAVGAERRFGLRLSGGVSNGTTVVAPTFGTATFRRVPFRLGAYLPVRLGPGVLEPGVGLDLEEIWVNVSANPGTESWRASSLCVGRVCLGPGADLALGWSLRSSRHVYVRVLAEAGAAVSYRFLAPDNSVIWSTPSTYLDLGIELGLWFR